MACGNITCMFRFYETVQFYYMFDKYPKKWATTFLDVSMTCLTGDSAMRSRGMEMRGRVEALLRDVEMRKKRNPRIEAATRARNASFVPFVLSSNGALGASANAFLRLVFGFVKKEGLFGMRSSHPSRA